MRGGSEGMSETVRDGGILVLPLKMHDQQRLQWQTMRVTMDKKRGTRKLGIRLPMRVERVAKMVLGGPVIPCGPRLQARREIFCLP